MNRRAPHPTAMQERPSLFVRWFSRTFFRDIVFPDEAARSIRDAAARGTIVYVCPTLSYIDFLYFSYAFLTQGLPLSRFANGLKTLLFLPIGRWLRGLWRLWRERRDDEIETVGRIVRDDESVLLFLRRPHVLVDREPRGFRGPYVEELIRIARERKASGAKPIFFVPLVLVWGSAAVRAKKAQRNLVDVVFGGRETPGRLRAIWMFLMHFRDSKVLVSPPVDLSRLVEEGEAEGLSDELLARRVRWTLGGRLESELRAVLGPPRKGAKRMCEEVLRSRWLVEEAKRIGAEEKISTSEIERRARACLDEIAADPKPWTFQLAKPILSWVWRKIYDGFEIDEAGLERVRAAARKGPLLLVPSHKSHVDYLVLSYLFSISDLVPPHIAAGANLSFFPIGLYFRRAGAFFLRRSFKGDRLYAAVFKAYVRKLLKEGDSVEFFIEGGRSRTGKLMSPRLGLLGMIVEGAEAQDGARARQAQIVPISIGYEKVIEGQSYAQELAGGEKKAEDVRGLLSATSVLAGRYGRLNIQFDEPFQLGEALDQLGGGKTATLKLAHRIIYGINRVTAVTPTALAAASLLATGKRGISRRDLDGNAAFLMARATALGGRLSSSVVDERDGSVAQDALSRALELLMADGDLQTRKSGGEEIYSVPDERRPRLTFYRNNAIHIYVADALVTLALETQLAHAKVCTVAELRERTLRLSRLLKHEFSYRVGETFDVIFDQTLSNLTTAKLIEQDASVVRVVKGREGDVSLLSGQVVDFVESYWIAAKTLEASGMNAPDKELVRRVHEAGERMFFTGEIRRREACLKANYQNAVAYFKERVESGGTLAGAAAEIADLIL